MEWTDTGIVLAVRRHGESAAIASIFTAAHGRHAGLVRGGAGRTGRGVLQTGNDVAVVWRARLADHLGSFRCELVHARAAAVLEDPLRLAAVAAVCAMLEIALPERHDEPEAFAATCDLLSAIEAGVDWPVAYVRWELLLLAQLGFGLDLGRCALTGATEDLAFVSPRSGRAVARAAAEPYRGRLLALPGFLRDGGSGGPAPGAGLANDGEVHAGLTLTGHFLARAVLEHGGPALPPARSRLVGFFEREATKYSGILPP